MSEVEQARRRSKLVVAASLGVALVVGLVVRHAASNATGVPASRPAKPVSVAHAIAKPFQPSRSYVGTLEPWLAANVGPQLISAYVETVDVRPGDVVKRGDLLATLDCRDASAGSQAAAMEARATGARQKALAAESSRVQGLLAKNFASPNEAQMKAAASAEEAAKVGAQQARLAQRSLEVADCVLRAPFDGEVATRTIDPGGFVRPGTAIVSIVDRATVRYTADVSESDFDLVAPGTPVRIVLIATKQELSGTISRRAPAADPSTRTVHFEVDLADAARHLPVGTTGEARIDVGQPEPATVIPSAAATVRGNKATVFVVEGDVAHARTLVVKGEVGGDLFVDPSLAAGAAIVMEGRALLTDGDRVSAKNEPEPPPSAGAAGSPGGAATASAATKEHDR